jgi:uncharacterized protein DUF5666
MKRFSGILALVASLALPGSWSLRADDGGQGGGGETESEAELTGVVQSLPADPFVGDWTVAGTVVHASASTVIDTQDGAPAVGAIVEAKGTRAGDGSIDATRIEVKAGAPEPEPEAEDTKLLGAIDALPGGGLVGDWTVGGKTVHVSASTKLETEDGAAFAVGATVEVEGTQRSDGSIDATTIELKTAVGPGPKDPPAPPPAAGVSFTGAVQALASTPGFVGDWTVAGVIVHVSDATRIEQEDAPLAIGATVEVKGTKRADGSVDARRIEVVSSSASTAAPLANTFFVASAARATGLNGAVFTTDLTIANTGASAAQLELLFLGNRRDGRTGPAAGLTLAAGASAVLKDVLGSVFGVGSGFGAIRISSSAPTLAITASTSTPGAGGRFGQGTSGLTRNELGTSGRSRSITGVESDARSRTNLMVVNATENELEVEVELMDDAGNRIGDQRLQLEPLEMRQLNDAPRELAGGREVESGRLVLSTPTPGGAFAAEAALIDNGTNDPRVLSAR